LIVRLLSFWLLTVSAFAGVLDRIAVTVGNDAITESEVLEEIRVTSFLNNEPLDFGGEARRAAAERLVDQYLIRRELASGTYTQPDRSQGERALEEFEKAHFRGRAEFEQKLRKYAITAEDLKAHLLFQLAALQFTEQRFGTQKRNEADRVVGAADMPSAAADGVDQQLDTWLKEQRSQTRVEFKKGAFQ
jgi:hypothetical protein